MLAAFALVLLAFQPVELVAAERCDLVELNHFYDEDARLVFSQVIFWDWSEPDARYMVRAWRLVKSQTQLPIRDWRGGGYHAVWTDTHASIEVLRHVHAAAFRETWTQYDTELVERDILPKERRRELWTPKPPRTRSARMK